MDDERFRYDGFNPAFSPRPAYPTYTHSPYAPSSSYAPSPSPYPTSPVPQSPYIPHIQQSPFIPYQHWTPPMSPVQRRPETWQYTPPAQFYTPYQPQFETPPQKFRNRESWNGPKQEPDRERKPYHPLPPAKRSDWVMWVGNVPQNTSHEELWRYFNTTVPPGNSPWKGPSSIFLISRSSCAFVNLSSQEDLDRAVNFFNGRPLRGWDMRCPRMVCRVRRKDDDLRAGVGAQRGTGMHREWVKASGPVSPAAMEAPPEGEGRRRESIVQAQAEQQKHQSTNSYASTNSSFLTRHFPKRVFILKSTSVAELEESVAKGTWRTQRHNEPILDQAFRTAPEVYLIFGANKSGEFFGYAKMVEPIDKERAAARLATMEETPEVDLLSSPVPMSSPTSLTPADEEPSFDIKSVTNPVKPRHSHGHHSVASAPADLRPTTLDPKLLQRSGMAGPIAALRAAERNAIVNTEPGTSDRKQEMDNEGVLRKDTIPSPEPKALDLEEGMGFEFKIEWVKVKGLPFGQTKHLRNPWNSDREVKISRDGTEVEPSEFDIDGADVDVGTLLLAEWDKL